ncbi:hypothetical protein GCM10025853_27810 [Tetragenococcus halophilus subsp. halophilus DSM 20339]|nr:hypothetical protein GCM10025853_27810 [Tetragenococcus halophilus subsp. halophilus DSM 20339]
MKKSLMNRLDAIDVFSSRKNEPNWMREMRQAALKKVDELDLRRIERVRYDRWPLFNIDEKSLTTEQTISENTSDFNEKKKVLF